MNCFNHNDVVALCVCANCFKGLCPSCAQPSSEKFSCSDICDKHIQQIARANNVIFKMYELDQANKPRRIGLRIMTHIFAALGIPFLLFGILEMFTSHFSSGNGWLYFLIVSFSFAMFSYCQLQRYLIKH